MEPPPVLTCTVDEWLDRVWECAEPIPPGQSVLLTDFDPRKHTQRAINGWARVVGGQKWHECPEKPTEEDWLAIFAAEWPASVFGFAQPAEVHG